LVSWRSQSFLRRPRKPHSPLPTLPRPEIRRLVPVVFLMLPVVVLFALYPGLFTLSRLAR
jgi:tight adherence protein C